MSSLNRDAYGLTSDENYKMGWYILSETYTGRVLWFWNRSLCGWNRWNCWESGFNKIKWEKFAKGKYYYKAKAIIFIVQSLVYFQCINLLNFWKKLSLKCSKISETKLLLLRCYCRLHANSSLLSLFQQNESISYIHLINHNALRFLNSNQ